MVQAPRRVRPATILPFPLAAFAAFVGIVFTLQLVSLMILVDLGLLMFASPYEDDGPVLAEFHQVRIANHPRNRAPYGGVRAGPTGADDRDRGVALVLAELKRYGGSVLRRAPLRRVVLCSNLTGEGRRLGGVILDGRGVILLDVGWRGPGTDGILRHSTHHEMSHILDDAFPQGGARDARWSRLNPAGFTYGGEEVVWGRWRSSAKPPREARSAGLPHLLRDGRPGRGQGGNPRRDDDSSRGIEARRR